MKIENPQIAYTIKAKRIRKPLGESLCDSDVASGYCRLLFTDCMLIHEKFYMVMVDRSNNIVGHAFISSGGVNDTIVDIRLVMFYAINSLCSGVICTHNHPSGKRSPSQSDIKLTGKIKSALELVGIKLLDHVIICDDKHYSFADEGLL